MAARPNNGDKSFTQHYSGAGGSSNESANKLSSSSSTSTSSTYRNVTDNVLNSWFFSNQNTNSQSSQNSGGKFKADMNLWMPQSM
jgi:hypothetical protein